MSADLGWDRNFALEQSGDDEEMLAELLDLLRETAAADLNLIREAIEASDPEALMHAAHSLKGATASMAVEKIRATAYDLECAGRDGRLDVDGQVNDLAAMVDALKDLA